MQVDSVSWNSKNDANQEKTSSIRDPHIDDEMMPQTSICNTQNIIVDRPQTLRSDIAHTPETVGSENDAYTQSQYDKKTLETQKLRLWISDTVGLPQYYQVFLLNGYETLDFVKEIGDKQELTDIGIDYLEHQYQILAEVYKLKLKEIKNEQLYENKRNEGIQRSGNYPKVVLNIGEDPVTEL